MKKNQKIIAKVKMLLLIFTAILAISACKKDVDNSDDDDQIDTLGGSGQQKNNYIPRPGFLYTYQLTDEDGKKTNIFKEHLSTADSVGIAVSDIRTTIPFEGELIHRREKMYVFDNFTITKHYNVEEWNAYINLLKESIEESGGEIKELKITGFPFSMMMDNSAAVGSALDFVGGPQELLLRAIVGQGSNTVEIKTIQTTHRKSGKAIRKETLPLHGRTYDCTVWRYNVENTIRTYVNGVEQQNETSVDIITVWTQAGIGEVFTLTENSKTGSSTLELISVNPK